MDAPLTVDRDPQEPTGPGLSARAAHPAPRAPDLDVLIVGAGISGIGMAVHLGRDCSTKRFAILERRADLGGTWDLFKYPGIRSDSDMYTLGFDFEPWREQKDIADGPAIKDYLRRIVAERGIDQHIRFGRKVLTAEWSSANAWWTVTAERDDGTREVTTARFLYLGSGYYDYDQGHDPDFPGRADFRGQVIHPQFWPDNLDLNGKRVVVIGSGATAVTLVPNLAREGAHVTMLQRTPTWYFIRPATDPIAAFVRKILPESLAYRLVRFKNVRMQNFAFKRARKDPEKVATFLTDKLRAALGSEPDPQHYRPPYGPWDQRLCLVPDADMFTAFREGKAELVTDTIERFDATGIRLASGRHLDADIIVTATGLKLTVGGKIAFSIDGQPIKWTEHFYYKGCMFSNVPNLAIVFGYLNASWTLKADIVSRYVCRLLNQMDAVGADVATPRLDPDEAEEAEVIFDFSSGYIQRSLDIMPRNGKADPWRLNQDYLHDRPLLLQHPIIDGVLELRRAPATVDTNAAR